MLLGISYNTLRVLYCHNSLLGYFSIKEAMQRYYRLIFLMFKITFKLKETRK